MKRLAIFVCVFSLFPISSVWAGFEWVPPSQNPMPTAPAVAAPMPNYQPYAMPVPPPMAPETRMDNAFPASPVMSEPLPTPLAPPTYNTPIVPPQPSRNLSKTGLVIDPYPLRGGAQGSADLTVDSVQQAMAQEAKLLHPLHLGAGMTTGVQPEKVPSASVMGGGYQNTSRGPISSNSGLTPMVGGEPAPLPNIANAYDQPAPVMPMRNYAEAVGFGRDLPLGLALSQVIPSEFSHSYVEGVDAGTTVSWEGGSPWNQVLQDMLKPKNLTASIEGNRVIIRPMTRL